MVLIVVARGDHPEGAGDPEIWAAQDRRSQMAKIAALAGLLRTSSRGLTQAMPCGLTKAISFGDSRISLSPRS